MKVIDPESKKIVQKENIMEFFKTSDFLDSGRGVGDEANDMSNS
eukprot:CAMPEP_0176343426 /NCGR_PEP_ID=MMETSP0126-20121128/3932_1 /TAXON_ID=141414 ORGANISM="Strombidinopsis acuminatum, Strain SPMC142" /NCGR_SAMPLE_ID=MMETSP0126 /ASSEMBLY_ACC=CAM_ASM_000229 /LENGTH=43 /DNA_ID= /DNA_START= /DNA_END= /DNA_ORIENTATION=